MKLAEEELRGTNDGLSYSDALEKMRHLKVLGGAAVAAGSVSVVMTAKSGPRTKVDILLDDYNVADTLKSGMGDALNRLGSAAVGWLNVGYGYLVNDGYITEEDCSGNPGGGGGGGNQEDQETPWSPVNYGIDPSGYVYEAVSTNRLEGVKTTVYYKEEESDEEGILWDAEEYNQENPS